MSNNVLCSIAVSVPRIEVPEEHDADTNTEHEHVGQKARWIEVIDKFDWLCVLLTDTVAVLVDDLISRHLIHHVAVHPLRGIICRCER